MLHRGDVVDGKYEILKLTGRGGMSKVWLAMDTHVNKQWAVKEIDKTTKEYRNTVDEERTRREIEIMKRLDHPALPRIVDVIENSEALCIVMDYIEGDTLLEILKTRGIPEQETVVSWMLDICDAIAHLHSFDPPIIYRDMKPANVMLTRDQRIKIVDFGIAKDFKEGAEDTQPLGTKGYASPEHWTKETDPRSDIFSIGRTMFHLLTGKDPTKMPLVKDFPTIREINPELSSGLEKIIIKATEEDKEKRYQSVGDLANALESYKSLEQEHIDALEKKERNFRRGILTGSLITALGLVMLTAGVFLAARSYQGLLKATPGTARAVESYEKAIELKPGKPEGYIKLLSEYTDDGSFTDEELSEYTRVYEKGRGRLERNDEDYSEVNYLIGESVLTYYEGAGDSSARARLIQAEPFFMEVAAGEKKSLADNYVVMAEFYKDFILADSTLVVKGATRENMEELLSAFNSAVQDLQKGTFSGQTKMKAIVYDFVLSMISTEASEMHAAGIAKPEIERLIEDISTDPELTQENAAAAKEASASVKRAYTEKNSKEVTYDDAA